MAPKTRVCDRLLPLTALLSAALAACGRAPAQESPGINRAALTQPLTIQVNGYAGPVCIDGAGCGTTFASLPNGTLNISAPYTWGADGTSRLGTIQVADGEIVSVTSDHFDPVMAPVTTLKLKTTAVQYRPNGTANPLHFWGINTIYPSGPSLTLIAGRRYALATLYAWHPATGSYWLTQGGEAGPTLEVAASGAVTGVIGARFDELFETTADGFAARATVIHYRSDGASNPIHLWGMATMYPSSPTLTVIGGLRYAMATLYAWNPATGSNWLGGDGQTSPTILVETSGSVKGLQGSYFDTFFETTPDGFSAREAVIRYRSDGAANPLHLWGMETMYPSSPTMTVVGGLRYAMATLYAWNPATSSYWLSADGQASPTVLVETTGSVKALQGSYFDTFFETTANGFSAREAVIHYRSDGASNPLHLWGMETMYPSSPTMTVVGGLRYAMATLYAWNPATGSNWLGADGQASPTVLVETTGSVKGLQGSYFDTFFETTANGFSAKETVIHYRSDGAANPIHLWGMETMYPGNPTMTVVGGLRYAMATLYAWNPATGSNWLGADGQASPTVLVETTGSVKGLQGSYFDTFFETTANGFSAKEAVVHYQPGGSQTPLYFWGLSTIYAQAPTVGVVAGLQYALATLYAYHPRTGSQWLSADGQPGPTVLVEPGGATRFVSGSTASELFDTTSDGFRARNVVQARRDPAGATVSIAGLGTLGPNNSASLPLLADLRYQVGASQYLFPCSGLASVDVPGASIPLSCTAVSTTGSSQTVTIDASSLGPGQGTLTSTSGQTVTIDLEEVRSLDLTVGEYQLSSSSLGTPVTFTINPDGSVVVAGQPPAEGGIRTLTLTPPNTGHAAIQWEMEPRFGKGGQAVFPRMNPNPATWNVVLDGCGSTAQNGPIVNYHWEVKGPTSPYDALNPGSGTDPGDPGGLMPKPTPSTPPPTKIVEGPDCRQVVPLPQLATYWVRLVVSTAAGAAASTSQYITLKDYLVVGMGDSYASGEGNPISSLKDGEVTLRISQAHLQSRVYQQNKWRDVLWDDPRRDLSRWSQQARAALMLELSDPHSSVTFVQFSQSGATIASGLLGPQPNRHADQVYAGFYGSPDHIDQHTMMPQIEQAQITLCGAVGGCNASHRKIDYLLLTVGGNDVGFGNVIATCGIPRLINGIEEWVKKPGWCDLERNCLEGGDERRCQECRYGSTNCWVTDAGVVFPWKGNRFTGDVDDKMEKLPGAYWTLDHELRNGLPIDGTKTKILITEYPNSVKTGSGANEVCQEIEMKDAGCGTGDAPGDPDYEYDSVGCFDGNIDAIEARWATDKVITPLNAAIYGTRALGWTPVGDFHSEFLGHAICQPSNFVIDYLQTWRTQGDHYGFFHPNNAGHEVLGRAVAKAMGLQEPAFAAKPHLLATTSGTLECPPGMAVAGVGCQGDRCAKVEVMCKPPFIASLPAGLRPTLVRDTSLDSGWAESLTPEDLGNYATCRRGGVATGIECSGPECQRMRVLCSRVDVSSIEPYVGPTGLTLAPMPGSVDGAHCRWTSTVSQRERWSVFAPGEYLAGLNCRGLFGGPNCEDISFRVCPLSRNAPPAQ